MASKTEKPKAKPKQPEPERDEHGPFPAEPPPERQPPKQRHQEVGASPVQPQAQPAQARIPRPQFKPQAHYSPPHVSGETQQVINALQQTVRSQAILIVQYQTLLKLDAMAEGESGQTGEDGESEAA